MRPSEVGAPVSQRLRDLLKDAGKPLAWGEIVGLLGPDTKMAARAAMKKLRARKEVAFRGGKYTWVLK